MVRYAVELAAALARRDDVELSLVVAPDAADSLPARLGVPASRVHVVRGDVVEASLRERFASHRAFADHDVVHGTKHLLPRHSDACRVLTVHDFLPLDRPEDFGRLKRRLLPPVYLASVRDADVLVCVSEATRRRLVELVPSSAARSHVVPLALSDALLGAAPEPIPALAGRRFAFAVGDTSPRKNLRLLADVWPAVRARVPDLVLAVAGPAGWGVDEGRHELGALVDAGAAIGLGHVDDAALRWAYAHASVVLCPSRLEGFGLPALEAATFGAPLVTSPDPALAEASGGRAEVVALDDPWGWVDAIVRHATSPTRPEPRPVRRWDDVAAETVAAVRGSGRR